MKKTFILVGALLLCIVSSLNAEPLTAEQVVEKAWGQFRQIKTETETLKITVNYKDGRPAVNKSVKRWTKFMTNGEDKTVIKFTEPEVDKGTGLLTLRNDAQDEQYLKTKSIGVRKVSPSDQSYFGGTDFTYEDIKQLTGEKTKNFTYTFLPDTEKNMTVMSLPKSGVKSGYSKRIFIISRNYVIHEIIYYDSAGNILKKQKNMDIKGETPWRPLKTVIDNVLLQRETVIEFKDRQLNANLPSNVFTNDFLSSERL